MADIAWYRKYRPSTIDEYMGDSVKHVVDNRFTVKENRPQVIMISGDRGCGKTTFARIISKYYLCLNPIDGKPCEECEMCRNVNDILIDGVIDMECDGVTEVDATTANGKEAIQDIISEAIIEPLYPLEYKILILDECHMITPAAQNSLLKIIEDIPEHLIVVFATTNIEKVLGTILSRCQIRLEVSKKTIKELTDRLMYICEQEGVPVQPKALEIIAKLSDRVPREAINLLENIYKNYGKVTVENVRESTGDIASEIYMGYIDAANSSLEDILQFNVKLKENNIKPKVFLSGLTRFILDSLYIRHGMLIEDFPPEYVQEVKRLFNAYTSSQFDTLLQVIEYANKTVGEDDVKGELILTTSALRIGKIGLLAEGLVDEQKQAEKENKQSIREYKRILDEEVSDKINKVTSFSPTKEAIASYFGGMKDVTVGQNIELIPEERKEKPVENSNSFSESELEKMLDEL